MTHRTAICAVGGLALGVVAGLLVPERWIAEELAGVGAAPGGPGGPHAVPEARPAPSPSNTGGHAKHSVGPPDASAREQPPAPQRGGARAKAASYGRRPAVAAPGRRRGSRDAARVRRRCGLDGDTRGRA